MTASVSEKQHFLAKTSFFCVKHEIRTSLRVRALRFDSQLLRCNLLSHLSIERRYSNNFGVQSKLFGRALGLPSGSAPATIATDPTLLSVTLLGYSSHILVPKCDTKVSIPVSEKVPDQRILDFLAGSHIFSSDGASANLELH